MHDSVKVLIKHWYYYNYITNGKIVLCYSSQNRMSCTSGIFKICPLMRIKTNKFGDIFRFRYLRLTRTCVALRFGIPFPKRNFISGPTSAQPVKVLRSQSSRKWPSIKFWTVMRSRNFRDCCRFARYFFIKKTFKLWFVSNLKDKHSQIFYTAFS